MQTLPVKQLMGERLAEMWGQYSPEVKPELDISASDDATTIRLYDVIGFYGIDAESFVAELDKVTAPIIKLHINSPGGSVFDGMAIYNALKNHPATIEVFIDGLAASMASVIALAGDTVSMEPNAMFMIHHPWSIAIGNAGDMRKEADVLDKISTSMQDIYIARSALDAEAVSSAIDTETYYNSDEAKEAGFIDVILKDPPKQQSEVSSFLPRDHMKARLRLALAE